MCNVFILCTEGHGPMVQYINNNNNACITRKSAYTYINLQFVKHLMNIYGIINIFGQTTIYRMFIR